MILEEDDIQKKNGYTGRIKTRITIYRKADQKQEDNMRNNIRPFILRISEATQPYHQRQQQNKCTNTATYRHNEKYIDTQNVKKL